ncbi:MAG: hypothetical protein VX320_07050 [Candidatus Thermoplasmatota archaeon]|nr:hypothetical protein [Candidatus Thermoplasmatota archaeon]
MRPPASSYIYPVLLLFFTSLMLPLVPPASATLKEMGHAGRVAELDESAIGWWNLENGNVLYASESGNVTEYSVSNNVYTEEWTFDINKTLYGASSINDEHNIAFGTEDGATVISTDYKDKLYSITTGQKVVGLSWDDDNDLWITGATNKRATEWTDGVSTSGETTTHGQQITDILALDDGKVLTSGRDKDIRVHNDAGSLIDVISIPNGELLELEVSDDGHHLFSITHNCILYIHNTTTWNLTTSYSICSGGQAKSMSQIGERFFVGTTNGRVQVIDMADFSKKELFTIAGVITDFRGTDSEGIFALAVFSDSSEIHLIDVDSDDDGTVDSLDWKPNDATQWQDTDGDGYGDNASGVDGDQFWNNPTQWADSDGDGIGDNYTFDLDGYLRINEQGDAFPNNANQSKDRDGDGYGDNRYASGGDTFIDDPEQWSDTDYDGYGDNPYPANNYDDCPNKGGQSTQDRYGCLDSDYDGWSDPDDDNPAHPVGDADPFKSRASQWRDSDGDGFGDNLTGFQGDSCPAVFGNSTRSALFNATRGTYDHVNQFGCVDEDGDGYSDVSESRTDECKMKDIKTEWIDHDRDCVGSNTDYNDNDPNIATLEDHCLENPNSTACITEYIPVIVEESSDDSDGSEKSTIESLKEFSVYAGIIAGVVIVALLIVVGIIKSMGNFRESRNKRKPDAQYTHQDATRELDAWESGESFETRGGIDEQKGWEDEPLADSAEQDSMDDLVDGLEDESLENTGVVSDGGDQSLEDTESTDTVAKVEEVADIDTESNISPADTVPATQTDSDTAPANPPTEAPPLPPGGLPEGWTTEQWRWYGHQWLERHGQK